MAKRAKSYDARLQAVASLVRQGAVLADVGSDHAYLPISLLQSGKIRSAVASDIHEGPIANARANIERAGLLQKIQTVCCDGLAPLKDYAPTDIVIAGMGGMLIVEILKAADFILKEGTRLILQPMRDAGEVRRFLADQGFAIVEERLCVADGKLYQIIAAEYDGKSYTLSPIAQLLGPYLLNRRDCALFADLVVKELKALSVRVDALASVGRQEEDLVCLQKQLMALLEELQIEG